VFLLKKKFDYDMLNNVAFGGVIMEQDRRIQKTKSAIYESLSSILLTKPITDISVTELCNKANINRKTFYAHYDTITDVVNEIFDEIVDNLIQMLNAINEEYEMSEVSLFSTFLISVMKTDDALFKMIKSPNGVWLTLKIQKAFSIVIEKAMIKNYGHLGKDSETFKIAADFVSSGAVMVLYRWKSERRPGDLDEITKLIAQLAVEGVGIVTK